MDFYKIFLTVAMLIACAFAVQSAAVEPQQQALAEEAPVLSPGSINPEEAPIHARSKKYAVYYPYAGYPYSAYPYYPSYRAFYPYYL
ncbi:hypothetical protein PGB90_008174 [Kerria lacca]